jgi:hypothetical protein
MDYSVRFRVDMERQGHKSEDWFKASLGAQGHLFIGAGDRTQGLTLVKHWVIHQPPIFKEFFLPIPQKKIQKFNSHEKLN